MFSAADGNGENDIMNKEEKIVELIADKNFAETLFSLDSEEEVVDLFARHDVSLTIEDVRSIQAALSQDINSSEELDEEGLENIAGGASIKFDSDKLKQIIKIRDPATLPGYSDSLRQRMTTTKRW